MFLTKPRTLSLSNLFVLQTLLHYSPLSTQIKIHRLKSLKSFLFYHWEVGFFWFTESRRSRYFRFSIGQLLRFWGRISDLSQICLSSFLDDLCWCYLDFGFVWFSFGASSATLKFESAADYLVEIDVCVASALYHI